MMDKGLATNLKIKSIVVKYPDDIRKQLNRLDWVEQQEFMEDITNPRQQLICDYALSRKETTLILFRKIEHGNYLYDQLLQAGTKRVFYIDGTVKGEDRERIRLQMEEEGYKPTVLRFGNIKVEIDGDEKVPLTNGKYKMAKDITCDDDVDDEWIYKYKKRQDSATTRK